MFNNRKNGFSLLQIVIALGLMSGLALMTAQLLKSSARGTRKISNLSDLNSIRHTLTTTLDCAQTLGNPALPAACGGPYTLRRISGDPITESGGDLGNWNLEANCAANEIIISGSENQGTYEQADIFRGTSDFCRGFFEPANAVFELADTSALSFVFTPAIPFDADSPPPGNTSPEGISTSDAVTYVARGSRLKLTLDSRLFARGTGRVANLDLMVQDMTDSNFLINENGYIQLGSATDGNSITMNLSRTTLVDVIPGRTYEITVRFRSADSGSSATVGSPPP